MPPLPEVRCLKILEIRNPFLPIFFFFICSFHLNVFLPLLPEVECQTFLDFRNPWGKQWKEVVSELNTFAHKECKIAAQSYIFDTFCLKWILLILKVNKSRVSLNKVDKVFCSKLRTVLWFLFGGGAHFFVYEFLVVFSLCIAITKKHHLRKD